MTWADLDPEIRGHGLGVRCDVCQGLCVGVWIVSNESATFVLCPPCRDVVKELHAQVFGTTGHND